MRHPPKGTDVALVKDVRGNGKANERAKGGRRLVKKNRRRVEQLLAEGPL